MVRPDCFSKVGPAGLLLAGWAVFCFGWAVAGRKPWMTRAFAEGGVRQVPLRDYVSAGLWIGLLISGALALVLLGLRRWWGRQEASPVRAVPTAGSSGRAFWFLSGLAVILTVAVWQRWPAMTHSFWGDEGWMFCDFVHGKWHPQVKGGSLQDALRFDPVTWRQSVFGDQSGNNHWLATLLQRAALGIWQKTGGHSAWEFEEWVVRLVPLAGGIASLAAFAGWLRWMGRPVTGLVGAAFMALHPWHVRFSVEARGYSLMLLFFILTLWAMMKALRDGRQRDWLLLGLMQFFMLYSWKGGVYALIFANAVLAFRLLRGPVPDESLRPVAVARWIMAGLVGAMFFIPLTMPGQLQLRKSIEEVRHRAKPMGEQWTRDSAAEILTGSPWVEQDSGNPREVSLQRRSREAPWTWPGVIALLAIFAAGGRRLWRTDRFLAWLCLSVLFSGVAAALHFKFALRVELLTWYLLYNLPVLALLFSLALTPESASTRPGIPGNSRPRWQIAGHCAAAAVALTGFNVLTRPMVRDFQLHPREDLRKAWEITRGAHEPRSHHGPTRIVTAWLWRHTYAYEPRADLHVRTREALHKKMEEARTTDGDFYMIVGIRDLSAALCPEVIAELRDPAKFDRIETLWGVESLNTLDVYRMRKP